VSTGLIHVVAGSTAAVESTVLGGGYAGDGGPASLALLNNPRGLFVDSAGIALYVADNGNYVVRYIDLNTGIIRTVAGFHSSSATPFVDNLPATEVYLANPQRVWQNENGDLYISEISTSRIVKVAKKTGILTTLVGAALSGGLENVAAAFTSIRPSLVMVGDSNGNLYFSGDGFRIQAVQVSSGLVKAVLGKYVTSDDASKGEDMTSINVDTMGSIYYIDSRNCLIRKATVTSSPVVSTASSSVVVVSTASSSVVAASVVAELDNMDILASGPVFAPTAPPTLFPTLAPTYSPGIVYLQYFLLMEVYSSQLCF
jgi:hypothetical protein